MAKLVSMGAFVYLMRTLSVARYGDLEFAFSVWFVLNLVQEAGLAPWGLRESARKPGDAPSIVATLISLRCMTATVSVAALAVLLLLLDRPPMATATTALFGAVLVVSPGLLAWAFQARDESHIPAITEMVRYGLFSLVVFGFVRGPQDVLYVPAAELIGVVTVVTIHNVLLRRRIGPFRFEGVLARARRALPEALPFGISSLTWALRTNAPLVALYLYVGNEATAQYGAGHRIVVAGHVFVWLYLFNLMPSLTRAASRADPAAYRRLIGTSLRVTTWIVFPACLVVSLLAPVLLPLLAGPRFAPGAEPFGILVWLLAIAMPSLHVRYALQAFDGQRDESVSILAGCLATIAALVVWNHDLTPARAAVLVPLAELLTLLVAALLLRRRAAAPGALLATLRPVAVTALAYVAARAIAPESPVAAAGLGLALCGVGLAALDRSLVGEALGFVRELRAGRGARPAPTPQHGAEQ